MFSRRSFLGGLFAAGALIGRPAMGNPKTFRMVYFSDYAPFSQADSSGRMRGQFVDAVDHILRDGLGLSVQHQGFPWARAQAMVKSGEADGFCTIPTPDRRAYSRVSARPVQSSPVRMVVSVDNPRLAELEQVRNFTDLKTFQLGRYIGGGWSEANLRPLGLSFQAAPDLTGALRLVANGRVDTMLDVADTLGLRVGLPEFQGKLIVLPTDLDWQHFHLCIGLASPFADLIGQVDAVMGAGGAKVLGQNAGHPTVAKVSW